jgi:hypothetical protein
MKKAGKEALQDWEQKVWEWESVTTSVLTPVEKFNEEMLKLQNLWNSGVVDQSNAVDLEIYGRAVEKVREEYEKATKALKEWQLEILYSKSLQKGSEGVWMDVGIKAGGAANELASSNWLKQHGEELKKVKTVYEELWAAIEGWGQQSASAIADFVTGVKTDFSDMVTSIINEIIRLATYKSITEPIATSLSSWLKGLSWFGGSSAGSTTTSSLGTNLANTAVAHSGWVVGSSAPSYRLVPAGIFANAPRLHSGLRPDEFPAILQSGEEVRSRAQVAADKAASSKPFEIHIHEAAGTKATVEQSSSGDLNIVIERIEQGIASRMSRGAGLSSFLDSRYPRKR